MKLNERAAALCNSLALDADLLRAVVHHTGDATIIDLGIETPGGLEAGLRLANICMAGLGTAAIVPHTIGTWSGQAVTVATDHPVEACMASQYAGWEVKGEKFFAMGSGPMRAAAGREPLFDKLDIHDPTDEAIGALETREFPPPSVIKHLADACGVSSSRLTLLVAPTASQAGGVQVVARSVETTLHKLFELGFDLRRIESGWGIAPLPPVAKNDLAAIGRTNDAILYGGSVTLWVRGDDDSLAEIGPKVPSSASSDHGQPFAAIFNRYGGKFYDIDPHLFSPAMVTLVNLDTGRTHQFGRLEPSILLKSFTS